MTYKRFEKLSKSEVLALVEKIGSGVHDDPLEDRQNDAPSMGEMLALEEWLGDRVTFHGYTITAPRDDYRVSLEGYEVAGLELDEFLSILDVSRYADDFTFEKVGNTVNVYTWWD